MQHVWLALALAATSGVVVAADRTQPADAQAADATATVAEAPGASMTPEQRARIAAKAEKIRRAAQHGPAGFPDLAQIFYVNSRTGPIITRGDNRNDEVRSISPSMYFDGMRQISRMTRYDSARGVYSASDEASGRVSDDPFRVAPRNALGSWTSIGPANQGGRTRGLLIDPVNPNRMYAAGVAGGIWRSTDAGANWTTNTDQLENLAVVALAFDPANSSIIYAGTGEGVGNFDAVRGAGVFRSLDAGNTWTQLAATNNSNFHYSMAVQVSPVSSQRIWVATRTGVFRSNDGGVSFTAVAGITANGGCTDMALQRFAGPPVTANLFVSCGTFTSQGRVYRIADEAASSAVEVLADVGQSRSSIAVAPSDPNTVYVMASRSSGTTGAGQYGLRGIYRSTTGGGPGSFVLRRDGTVTPATETDRIQISQLTNPVFALTTCVGSQQTILNQGWYDNVIAVDPVDPNIVWTGGIDLFRSNDGGANWGVASYWWFGRGVDPQYAHADQHAIVFHPQYDGVTNRTMYVGNDGGVQRTLNARANVGNTVAAVCGTPVAGAVTWEDRSNGYVTTQFYDGVAYPDGLTYFGGLQDNGTLRGTSANLNWSVLAGGDGGYVAVDTLGDATPGNDVLFLENTGNSMRRSTNGGSSFSSVAVPGASGFLFIAPFTMDEGNRQRLWTGGFDIWRTTNQATNWTRMTSANGTCGVGSISAVAVHPTDGNRVLVGMSDGCYHVRTDALGAATAGLWPGGTILASNFISWIAWDPTNVNIAYATISNFGVNNVFKTINGGTTWSPSVGSGAGALPQIPALSVAVNPNNGNQVFVGTDLGVFTSNDGGASWVVENTGFARTPVEALKFNQAGTRLFAFTHGRGAWRTEICTTCRSIGGTVSGLSAGNSVQLRLNGGPALTVNANGAFAFPDTIATGDVYAVTVSSQPAAPPQTCTVTNGTGTVPAANVTNVQVTCVAPSYTIGGTLSGLAAGATVVLRNNGGNDLVASGNGGFAFGIPLADGSPYSVTVFTQPTTPPQTCVVTNGSGTVAGANVTNVSVVCTTNTYTIGGTVSGLATGNDVVLRNNGGNDLTVAANGSFTFSAPITDGGSYAVTVFTQPTTPNQTCVVTNGSGTVAGANVTNVSVVCTTNTYTIGGTLSGLAAGATVVLRNNGGNDLVASGNGGFAFGIPLADGSPYSVTVFTQPTTPNQTCVVTNGSGTLAGANVTNVSVVCTTNTYTIGGTVSGLTAGNSVVLRNNGGNNLTVSANGTFAFSTPIVDGGAYAVTVFTQPTAPPQTCVVSNGSGTVAGANVTNVSVACTTNTYTIGGTVSGLAAGNDVVLRNNGGNNLTVTANGTFTFSTPVTDGGAYAVTVFTQPTTPNQTCVVTNGNGTVTGANVTNVSVVCTTNTYTIGGTVSGLAAGNDVILRNNGGNDLTVAANGSFTFSTPIIDGGTYAVTVFTQPTTPNQTCVVTNGSGTVAGANVTNVSVVCTTNTYTIGGTVSGLAAGNDVILRNNGGNDLTVAANGSFTFSAPITDGGSYAVTVFTQPTTPNQTCVVTNGSGTVAGANVTNVSVVCTTNTYTVGGTVSGLTAGNSVVLRNNGGNNLTVSANGTFAFSTPIADGGAYAVTVFTQPTAPPQTCVVSNGSGAVAGANVTNVSVACTTNTYTIGGTVSGLAAGNDVVLRNNGGNDLTVSANGTFTFSTPVTDGGAYAVTVFTQPTTPNQTCVVTNGNGTVAGANVTNVSVVCTTNTYTIGGTVSGLAAGNDVILRNNGGNDLTVAANGSFTFSAPITDGGSYAVTVFTQPTTPNQTCVVTNGSGTVAGANVTNVSVVCTTNTYTIGGTVSGLAAGNDVILRNNGGNDLTVSANGSFTFSTPIVDGGTYAVTVLTQPTTPNQTCSVTNGSGTVAGANVTSVSVVCNTLTYTIGGTVSGLAAGNDVVLRNNGGNNLTVTANGSFTFSTPVTDGGTYAVTVFTQPTTPNQTCVVTGGSGTVAGANVTNVSVTCTTTTYTIGGTVSGLTSGNSVVLRNNGGNDLTVSANGTFTFSSPVTDGGPYAVTVFTQPTAPPQTCVVTNGSGTVAGANVTNVSVVCATNTYTIGGTVIGLAAGNDVVLRNNGGNDLTVNANGSFTFSTPIVDGGTYAVTVLTQPTTPNQTCVVTSGSGTVAGANVTNVSVVCTTNSYTIGGTVTGLAAGSNVVLRNNGGNDLTINANGSFTFSAPVTDGGAYAVTVFTQPSTPPQTCTVTSGSGTLAGANVTSVVVTCAGNAIFSDGFEQ